MLFWESNVFWGVAGIVAGVVVATFYFLIGKSNKLLEYEMVSTNLITDSITNIPGISIMFDGKSIENLVSTTIKFINSGNQTIVSSDFAVLEPLGVTVTGQFLSTQHGYQVSCDNPNSCPCVKIVNSKIANIEFDFLKPKQSLTITVWHNGKLFVLGELKTGKKREYRESYSFSKHLCLSLVLFSFIDIYIIFMFLLATINGDFTFNWTNIDFSSPIVLFTLALAISFVLVLWLVPILLDIIKQNIIR